MIIDGMDQAKTKIPNKVRHSKDTDPLFRQAVHVTGILDHGADVPAHVLLEDCRATKDPNNTINALCHALRAHQVQGPLPEILYLQLDNAVGENKNRFVLLFCALLVGAGVFKKVKLSFLPVGHTHEDIDQIFSRFAEALRHRDCNTWADLEAIIASSWTSSNGAGPKVTVNPEVPDFKGWMDEHTLKVHGHTGPMCFRFTMSEDDNVLMGVRGRTSVQLVDGVRDAESSWFPEEGGGYVMISGADARKLWEQPLYRVPVRTVPTDAIRETVETYTELGLFDESMVDDWEIYFANTEADIDNQCEECSDLRTEEAETVQVIISLLYISDARDAMYNSVIYHLYVLVGQN